MSEPFYGSFMETSSLTLKSMLMARKIFVPKMTELDDEQIKKELDRIKTELTFLTEKELGWLKVYCEPWSNHLGSILTEGGNYPVYPSYDMGIAMFLRDNPSGEVWKFESEK